MGILYQKINEKINSIKSEFLCNKSIEHNGVKGSFNESELDNLIKEVIPKRYILTKGIVENSEGKQSNETDIIIYDNDILPFYIKNNLSFVPVEAVKYIFEVKSLLNATELKTTIDKFYKFRQIGGISPTVLFSFSSDIKGDELDRYYNYDLDNFFINPIINVLCISNKCYCFKSIEEHYLTDFFTNEEWLNLWEKNGGVNYKKELGFAGDVLEEAVSNVKGKELALLIKSMIQLEIQKQQLNSNDYNLNFNGIDFKSIKFKIHTWNKVHIDDANISNSEILSFLTGISNTLSQKPFGNYLLNNKNIQFKVCAVCYEDMWGNLSCQDFDSNGLNYNVNKFGFSYNSNSENNTHKMIFNITEKNEGK